MSENNNIIVASKLSKKYNEHLVVDDLNLTIKKGEIFGLLGPNGAGKSTIILMTLGLTEPTSGSITVGGFNSTREALKVKRITGYLPERVGFYDDLSAKNNLSYTAELNNIPFREIPKKIDEALEMVALTKNKNQLVKTFSKGKLITEGSVESLGRNMLGGGKYRIELELEKVTVELVEKLKKVDKVISVSRSGNQLQIMSDKDIRQDISRFIAAEGVLLTKMDMKKDALEEIYLKYFKEE